MKQRPHVPVTMHAQDFIVGVLIVGVINLILRVIIVTRVPVTCDLPSIACVHGRKVL